MARFSVAFGMNETPLTKALQIGQFSRAEILIKERNDQNMLDEGAYQLIPLYIALSRHSNRPVNFYIAKLLIEFGASTNLRVPEMDSDAECITPGQSALELLLELYIRCRNRYWNPKLEPIIGLDRKLITDPEILHEQIIDFAEILINSGADVNIQNETGTTLLHQLVGRCCDTTLVQLLLDARADINIQDNYGNTPLLLLFMPHWVDMGRSLAITQQREQYRKKCLQLLLKHPYINIDLSNHQDCTPLIASLAIHDFESARLLLEKGANPSTKARLIKPNQWLQFRYLSPLFTSFITVPLFSQEFHWGSFKSLIDTGFFTCEEILDDVRLLASQEMKELESVCEIGPQLINLMFGGTTTCLSQLCVQTLFTNCQDLNLLKKTKVQDLTNSTILNNSSESLRKILQSLDLPQFLLTKFKIELLAQKIRSYCRDMFFVNPADLLLSDEDESYDESDESSDFEISEDSEQEE